MKVQNLFTYPEGRLFTVFKFLIAVSLVFIVFSWSGASQEIVSCSDCPPGYGNKSVTFENGETVYSCTATSACAVCSACPPGEGKVGDSCTNLERCGSGDFCIEGSACSSDSECGSGETCVTNRQGCNPSPVCATCSEVGQVEAPDGSCVECTSDSDCSEPHPACDTTLPEPKCVECVTDGDCGAGDICSSNTCREPTCNNDGVCDPDETAASCPDDCEGDSGGGGVPPGVDSCFDDAGVECVELGGKSVGYDSSVDLSYSCSNRDCPGSLTSLEVCGDSVSINSVDSSSFSAGSQHFPFDISCPLQGQDGNGVSEVVLYGQKDGSEYVYGNASLRFDSG